MQEAEDEEQAGALKDGKDEKPLKDQATESKSNKKSGKKLKTNLN